MLTMAELPFSQACENNKAPILSVLQRVFADCERVLEIGAGTGQHAVHFAPALPHLQWQPSDLTDNHPSIQAWRNAYPAPNLLAPVVLDLGDDQWPGHFDAVFSANTAHIVSPPKVENFFSLAGKHLPKGGVLALYGPFNYSGDYTSDSNRQFDAWLKARDPSSGIRDVEWAKQLAQQAGLLLKEDNAMPANNRLLVWVKQE